MLQIAATLSRRGALAKTAGLAFVIGGFAAGPAQAERVSTDFSAPANAYSSFGQDITFVTARSGFRWNVVGNLRAGSSTAYQWSVRVRVGPDGSRSLSYTMLVREGEGQSPTVVTTPAGVRCQTGTAGEGGGDPAAFCTSPFPSAIGSKTLRVVIRNLTPTSTTGTTWQAYAELKGGTRYVLGSLGVPATGQTTVNPLVRNSTEDWTIYGTCPTTRIETVYGPPTFRLANGTAALGTLTSLRGKACAASQIAPFYDGVYHRLGN